MALVPPQSAETDKIYRWRLVVAGALIGVIMATASHIAWACGFLAPFGLGGFAMADDVTFMRAQLTEIQVTNLGTAILQTRTAQCQAIRSQNQQALTVITAVLQDTLDRYEKITTRRYILPDCNTL